MSRSANDIARASLDAAYQYAEDIADEKIPACRYVKLAVKRWFDDHEQGVKRGIYFDENAAARVFKFFEHCRHYQGEWAGTPIRLSPWQCFVVANVFGWLREDGTRRFRTVYEEIPRKNGKTTKLGGIGLYGLLGDNEPGAKIYSAATKRDQAKELFVSSKAMVMQSPALSSKVKTFENEIKDKRTGLAEYLPLSADAKSMDGLNVHYGLVDELHAHKNSQVWDVIKSALGARSQPLVWAITTAGFNHDGVCYQTRDYAIKVLEGAVENDSFFAIIYTIDQEDLEQERFYDEEVWQKANPNYGVSVKPEYLADQARMAKDMPSEAVNFLTKHLNVWVYGESRWMNMEKWNACATDFDEAQEWAGEGELAGMECDGGLDLACIEDMNALSFSFTMHDGSKRILTRAWLPQETMEAKLKKRDYGFLEDWRRKGILIVTPGAVADYSFIRHDIEQACRTFRVRQIAFDRYNASQLVTELMASGIEMVGFGQGFASMSPAMKEVLRLVVAGRLQHNNPLLTWAMSNVVADINPAGDIKPNKGKVSEKIDPAVSAIMAIGIGATTDKSSGYVDDISDLIDFG